MRFLFWLTVLPLAVLTAWFAAANREPVAIDLDPFPFAVEIPLFAVPMGALFVGLVVGGTAAWFGQRRWRRQTRALRRRARQLEAELDAVRSRAALALTADPESTGGGDRRAGGA